jgi:hypothetical protein
MHASLRGCFLAKQNAERIEYKIQKLSITKLKASIQKQKANDSERFGVVVAALVYAATYFPLLV